MSSVLLLYCRYVFAVVTISSVLVYDTQHPHPIARIGGMHWASINDAAWTPDGMMLIVCSSDGYITFVRFAEGALGRYSMYSMCSIGQYSECSSIV